MNSIICHENGVRIIRGFALRGLDMRGSTVPQYNFTKLTFLPPSTPKSVTVPTWKYGRVLQIHNIMIESINRNQYS